MRVPQNRQPYATIITKDYPGDVQAGTAGVRDSTATDAFLPHPVCGALGWLAVVNPGERTIPTVAALLREAHDDDQRRVSRRG
ncbi:hypothetical protein CTB96_17600 [Cryobacterium arcticum]|uniref:DUF6194 domain-containing protein n=1 Tax=Cryobacterium arcticum TaxID=670052 RepID=A0A317ZW64_9MICO|nr:DUF6194 family protein [Cryobacterium arcticum]PXA68417.1 hypothetical protein CTB96_17600 [Cryobacterium arcticum]